MTLDASLSILHWWAVILLIVALVGEKVLISSAAIDAVIARRLGRYDLIYGIGSLLMLAAGFARAVYGAKGWAFYSGNPMFWTKIGLFVLIGLLSIPPTIAFRRWSKSLAGQGAGAVVAPATVAGVRRWLDIELLLLVLLPVAAAMMARGIGY